MEFQQPYRGIFKGFSVDKTPNEYSPSMQNVRPIDVLERRVRLGQRPGLDKWGAGTQIGGAEQPIVALISVSSVKD